MAKMLNLELCMIDFLFQSICENINVLLILGSLIDRFQILC